jgi:hypothetical protein
MSSGSARRVRSSSTAQHKKTPAWDKNFEQNIINENIFPEGYEYPNDQLTPEPDNEEEVQEMLARSRPSLSLSRFTDLDFRKFKRDNSRIYESTLMGTVFPTIRGEHTEIPHELNAPFKGLANITNNITTTVQPDFYDGANPGNIDKQVRDKLGPFIIPTVHPRAPVVPNFFLEAKPPSGGVDVAKLQATLDGALGARAMHKLQSYGEKEPIYDNNAYTITSTYHDGTLKIYTTHITPPAGPGQLPEYHMTQQRSFAITDTPNTCRQGLAAFRNSREWSRKKRDQLISAANEKARSMNVEPPTLDSPDYSGPPLATETYPAKEFEILTDELPFTSFVEETLADEHIYASFTCPTKDEVAAHKPTFPAYASPTASRKRPCEESERICFKAPRYSISSRRRRSKK